MRPHQIAVAVDDRVRAAVRSGFVRVQRRVNAAVDDERAARPRGISDFVTAMRVARVNADADDVAGVDVSDSTVERFVDQMGVPYRSGVAAAST